MQQFQRKNFSILEPKYRTNRTGGSLGNMNGQNVQDLRNILTSGEVMNGIPKTNYGQITVPYYSQQDSTIINKLIPYYIAITESKGVVEAPYAAKPTLGWLIESKLLYQRYGGFSTWQ